MQSRLLIVDDEEALRFSLAALLADAGHSVRVARDITTAIGLIENEPFDLVITDLKMPELGGQMNEKAGETLIRYVTKNYPGIPVVVISGMQTSQSAAAAMKAGAVDYIDKPFDRNQVTLRISSVLERPRERDQAIQDARITLPGRLVAQSGIMQQLVDLIARVSAQDINILIAGPPGSGKEEIARAVHAASKRANGRLVALRCGGAQEHLMEDDLFGHERGAFSGADRVRRGLFDEAAAGTLLLDGVEDLPMSLQGKLVSIFERHEYRRLGGNRLIPLTCRLISTTTENLRQKVREEEFREDLLLSLRVVQLDVPALKNRLEDLPELAERALQAASMSLHRNLKFHPKAVTLLSRLDLPGNIRELRNLVTAAASLALADEVTAANIEEALGDSLAGKKHKPVRDSVDLAEKERILEALRRNPSDLAASALELGYSRTTLWRRMQKYELEGF